MIVPLPIYVTDPAEAAASLLRLLGDLRLLSASSREEFLRVSAAATDALYATEDLDEISALADELVTVIGIYGRVSGDRAVAERQARDVAVDAVELANVLVDLRYRYERLDRDIEALSEHAEGAAASAPSRPTLPIVPGPLRVV